MKEHEILANIHLVTFPSTQEAAKTFIRFQEHYESPKFRNKLFTLKEYQTWYKKQNNRASFTYYNDWSGFNIPSYALLPFYSGAFGALSSREKKLLDLFQDKSGLFYVIGTAKNDEKTLDHEIMHGLYYTNYQYRSDVDRIIFKYSAKFSYMPIYNLFEKMGYHHSVFIDELHAYLVTCQTYLRSKKIDVKMYVPLIQELDDNFAAYARVI